MDISLNNVKGKYAIIEPGDMTMYCFIITESPSIDKNYLLIAGGYDAPKFRGYLYNKISILNFVKEVGVPSKNKEEYHFWPDKREVSANPYLSYVITHSECDKHTALAAILSAWTYITEGGAE